MEAKIAEAVEALESLNEDDGSVLFTGGKDSMVMLHLWREHINDDHPPLVVIDTGNQFDSIYDHRDKLVEDWGVEYTVYRNDDFIENVIGSDDDDRGYAWDGPKTDGCCGALKVDMIEEAIRDGHGPLCVGRRSADVGHDLPVYDKNYAEPIPHDRVHPLADWSDAHIKAYIKKHSVPLPSLYDEGYEHTDCVDCTQSGEEGDDWSAMDAEDKEQLQQLRDMGYM